MSQPFVLGIAGKKGCGKDTLANKLKEMYEPEGFKVSIRPMAAYLKDVLAVMLNVDRDKFEDRDFKESDSSISGWGTNREVMQGVGQALRDGFRSNIWIDLWLRDYYIDLGSGQIEAPPDLIIIPDIRLKNESQMVHSLNGINIKLHYGLLSDKKYEVEDKDITEQGIPESYIDYHLASEGDFISVDNLRVALLMKYLPLESVVERVRLRMVD